MNITVRRARKEEATRLGTIALASKKHWNYPDHWLDLWGKTLDITPEFIESHNVWVALKAEVIIGFVALSRSGVIAELEHMWVLPEYMRIGVGKKLMSYVLSYCKKVGVTALSIESDPNARGFYEKLGARHVGEVTSKPSPRVLPLLMIDVV